MAHLSSSLIIPDSLLAREATDLLREHSTDLLFNHSMRVYFFAAEQGRQRKLCFDPELLYVAAAFHDFGLIKKFSSPDERFEVDGANAARQFLTAHKVPEEQVEIAWQAIALHTTPGVTHHMRPEVALLYSGVGLDVLGKGLDQFLRSCGRKSWPNTLESASRSASFKSTSPALRTSPARPTAP
jgi:HD domain-containing protein